MLGSTNTMKVMDNYNWLIEAASKIEKPKEKNNFTNYWFTYFIRPNENQVEKAFNDGTKLICDLLSTGKIEVETARDILSHFVQIYIEYKYATGVHKFLKRSQNRPMINVIKAYLGAQ